MNEMTNNFNFIRSFVVRSRVDNGVSASSAGRTRSQLREGDLPAREAPRAIVVRVQGPLRRLLRPRQVRRGLLLGLQRDFQVRSRALVRVRVLVLFP